MIAETLAEREGVAVCRACLARHPKASALAPWSQPAYCKKPGCRGRLIFPRYLRQEPIR